jgi:2-dehydropantoate 2-reductase
VPEVAVIGAGAVGTVAASDAEQAGLDVVICARSPVGPVVLDLDGQERRVAAPVVCDPGEVRPMGWVLLSGAITRLGRRHGVPTPANQAL